MGCTVPYTVDRTVLDSLFSFFHICGFLLQAQAVQGVPVQEYPEEMAIWQERAQWINAGLCDASKTLKQQLADFLTLCNSDSKRDRIVHYCKGCCNTEEDAMDKVLRAAVPFFSRGYPVPLLHRFKHYAVASSFIKTASCCFSLLPRVMRQMQENAENQSDAASALSGMVDDLLQNQRSCDGEGGDLANYRTSQEFQARLSELLDSDLSFSLQNSIRRRLVTQELTKPGFTQGSMMVDALVGAMEYGTHFFLKRTTLLTRIVALGSAHPEHDKLSQQSKNMFLEIVSGKLGRNLVQRVLYLLEDGLTQHVRMGLDASQDQLLLFFQLVMAGATDIWRRMVHEMSGYPYHLFTWISHGFTLADFVRSWDAMLQAKSYCSGCVDATFSSVLAMEHPEPLGDKPRQQQLQVFAEVTQLLKHIASYTPTNSDSVGVKHGQTQWVVSKRGAQFVKKQRAAKESSLLQSSIRLHGVAFEDVYSSTMPSRLTSSSVKKRLGIKGKNQHSKKDRFECLKLKLKGRRKGYCFCSEAVSVCLFIHSNESETFGFAL